MKWRPHNGQQSRIAVCYGVSVLSGNIQKQPSGFQKVRFPLSSITVAAHAKINLTLYVGNKRSDGYHDIDSIMHQIVLSDEITVSADDSLRLHVAEGNAPAGEDNLMWTAARRFLDAASLTKGLSMILKKRIPSPAGMGGGSADAAAVLLAANEVYDHRLSQDELLSLAASLGADVPFCLAGGCARCQGIGEKMTPVTPWHGLPLVIVRPDISVSTGAAYAQIDASSHKRPDTTEQMVQALEEKNISLLSASLMNHFEEGLFPQEDELARTSEVLSRFGRPFQMTGSGSAFFLIADDLKEASRIAETISREHPAWYTAVTETL